MSRQGSKWPTAGNWRQGGPSNTSVAPGSQSNDHSPFGNPRPRAGSNASRRGGFNGGGGIGAEGGQKRFYHHQTAEGNSHENEESSRESRSGSITTPPSSPPEYKTSLDAACDKIKAATAALSQITNSKSRPRAPYQASAPDQMRPQPLIGNSYEPSQGQAQSISARGTTQQSFEPAPPQENPMVVPAMSFEAPSKAFNWADSDSDDDQDFVPPVVEVKRTVEAKPIVEDKAITGAEPVVAAEPTIEENPVVEEKVVGEEKPVVENKPIVEAKPVVEAVPIVQAQPAKMMWADLDDDDDDNECIPFSLPTKVPEPEIKAVQFPSSPPSQQPIVKINRAQDSGKPPGPRAPSQSRPQMKIRAESNNGPYPESRPPRTDSKTRAESRPRTEIKLPRAESRARSEIKGRAESRSRTEHKGRSEIKARAESTPRVDIDIKVLGASKLRTESKGHDESKPRLDNRPSRTESKPRIESKVRPDSRPRPQSKPRTQSTSRPPSKNGKAAPPSTTTGSIPSFPSHLSNNTNKDVSDLANQLSKSLAIGGEKSKDSFPPRGKKVEDVIRTGGPGLREYSPQRLPAGRKNSFISSNDGNHTANNAHPSHFKKDSQSGSGTGNFKRTNGTPSRDSKFKSTPTSTPQKGGGDNNLSPFHPAEAMRSFRPTRPQDRQQQQQQQQQRQEGPFGNSPKTPRNTNVHGTPGGTPSSERMRPTVNLGAARRMLMNDLGIRAVREPRTRAGAAGASVAASAGAGNTKNAAL